MSDVAARQTVGPGLIFATAYPIGRQPRTSLAGGSSSKLAKPEVQLLKAITHFLEPSWPEWMKDCQDTSVTVWLLQHVPQNEQ